jgi:hypothetical protein
MRGRERRSEEKDGKEEKRRGEDKNRKNIVYNSIVYV